MPKRTIKESTSIKRNEEEIETLSLGQDADDLSDSEESEYSGLEDEGDDSSEAESVDEDEDSAVEDELRVTKITHEKVQEKKEMEEADTSDEEDIRNTVGNIPMEWYNDYEHYGYNVRGSKLMKNVQGDQLDDFLSKMENPDYWRTVYDKQNMQDIKLTDEEIGIIERIEKGKFPEEGFDEYAPYVDYFTGIKMIHPIKDNPASKSSFVPSKWEHKKVVKIARAIRNGWIKPKKGSGDKPQYYLLWAKDDTSKDHVMHWPAPKLKLPGHEESYNPPPEYLPTEEEKAAWEAMDPEDRPQNFLSQKFDSLRKVPGYSNFINEKFDRCLDLYLCARQRKVRLNIDPEDLIPKLPRPRDLQPYPTTESIIYKGHNDKVTCISVDPTGQWLVSGSSDKSLRFWEIVSSRCVKEINVDDSVHSVQWNSFAELPLIAAAVGNYVLLINAGLGDKLLCRNADKMINDFDVEVENESLIEWTQATLKEYNSGVRLKLLHKKAVRQVTWHAKGDYFATVCPEGENKSIHIHQLSKRKSQCPFKKAKGQVQCVRFHPSKPLFFVATQRYIRVYNLQKQELTNKLMSGVKWISSIDVHPKGDNLVIGSYDKRVCWFDMDLSSKPYKILRHHKQAVRQVSCHQCYPLFASASDDGSVVVNHATVYNDLMQNPLIVPLKILRGHKVTDNLGVLDVAFHPSQPWLFTCGSDKTIRLFT